MAFRSRPSARLFLRVFRLRPLKPLVSPLHELILFLPIPFLDFADKLVVVPLDLLQVIIGKLAPLLFEFTFELHPFPFELLSVHEVFLLCEMAMPRLGVGFRSLRSLDKHGVTVSIIRPLLFQIAEVMFVEHHPVVFKSQPFGNPAQATQSD